MEKKEQIWTNCPRCDLSHKGSYTRCPTCGTHVYKSLENAQLATFRENINDHLFEDIK